MANQARSRAPPWEAQRASRQREGETLKISVVVSTFRRSTHLSRCLGALRAQRRAADEVILVVRDADAETEAFLAQYDARALPLRVVTVALPGLVESWNAGLGAARGDVIAITDDDAAPWRDWLLRIEQHFAADPALGGLGGRDWMYVGDRLQDGAARVVGRVQWFGRIIGNHHQGVGPPREVDLLKGVNMSFRRAAVEGMRFDRRLRGTGAQVHIEDGFVSAIKRAGWRVLYDPAVAVDHMLAPRFDEDQRGVFQPLALRNEVHNETLFLLEHLPAHRRPVFLAWAVAVGTRAAPGLAQCARMMLGGDPHAGRRLVASLLGRKDGWSTARRPR